MPSTSGYWFKSTLFEVESGEDEETNPGVYGRQLASWLREQFLGLGYAVGDVIPEDWGWCVMCQRDPFMLWVGCGNVQHHSVASSGTDIVWHVFSVAEVPRLRYLLRRKPSTRAELAILDDQLGRMLRANSKIEVVDEP